jgi:hypothetical protein
MSSSKLLAAVLLPLFAGVSLAQDTTVSIAPAVTTVPSVNTDANIELFGFETAQLTEEVVLDLHEHPEVAEFADLFQFGSAKSNQKRLVRECKTSPGDALWPSQRLWKIFDLLLGGALSPIVPIASPCYANSSYNNADAAKCAAVVNGWATEELHFEDPGSIMFPIYQGKTCWPGTDASQLTTCTQGGYSIKVRNVAQIQLAVNFARLLNLRLVIKNTGHDYNGRSTGKNALSLWTHNLKDVKFIENYVTDDYQGPAVKAGAGVQVHEMYQAAEQFGVSLVGGICPTVGVVGGYIAGGGHSPLMQLFGMGADQVLALEVVTADGRFLTVTPKSHSDLYWAMLGGGGGTFGIVTSAVIKAHPKVPVTTSKFVFAMSPTVSEENFWEAFSVFWDMFPALNEAGTYSYFSIFNISGSLMLSMDPFFAVKKTVSEFEELLAPLFNKLNELNIPYQPNTQYHTSFLSAYDATFLVADQSIGAGNALPGTRIMPTENWNNATIRADTIAAMRTTIRRGGGILAYNQAPKNPRNIINSVNPAFRNEASMIIAISPFVTDDAQLGEAGRTLTNDILGPLRDVSPAGGAYGNEAEVNEPNWQQAFWGNNYPRLLSIKKKWDPTGLFYAHHGVGSEDWEVRGGLKWGGVPTQDGILCRV